MVTKKKRPHVRSIGRPTTLAQATAYGTKLQSVWNAMEAVKQAQGRVDAVSDPKLHAKLGEVYEMLRTVELALWSRWPK